jgi:hypothetical protein
VTFPIYRMPIAEKLAVHGFVIAILALLFFTFFYLPFLLVAYVVDLSGILTVLLRDGPSPTCPTLFVYSLDGNTGASGCGGAAMRDSPSITALQEVASLVTPTAQAA